MKKTKLKARTQQSDSNVILMIGKTPARSRVWSTSLQVTAMDTDEYSQRAWYCAPTHSVLSVAPGVAGRVVIPFTKETTKVLTTVCFKPRQSGSRPRTSNTGLSPTLSASTKPSAPPVSGAALGSCLQLAATVAGALIKLGFDQDLCKALPNPKACSSISP